MDRHPSHRRLASLTGSVSILLTLILTAVLAGSPEIKTPVEYLFSPLFNLPGTAEPLSFSLIVDALTLRWLIYLSLAVIPFQVLHSLHRNPDFHATGKLAAIHLAQAGLNTLFLAGSLVTGVIGWGLALGAIILSNAGPATPDSRKRFPGFMTLMLTVFFLIAAIFLFYAVIGKLSYTNDPLNQMTLLQTMLASKARGIVISVLSTAGALLLLSVLPGMGLIPFTGWLDDTRDTHDLNALFIFTAIMPAGIIMLERYAWFYSLIPGLRMTLLAIALISLCLSWLAGFGFNNNRLILPWLAVTATSLLCTAFCLRLHGGVPFLLASVYPGFLLLGIGRILRTAFQSPRGKTIQGAGLILPIAVLIAYIAGRSPDIRNSLLAAGMITAFLIPAFRVFRNTSENPSDSTLFASSIGWTAYTYFGMPAFLKFGIAVPIQQIADGFWTLETYYNQFWQFGLGKLLNRWARLMWLFDCWFIKSRREHTEIKVDKL